MNPLLQNMCAFYSQFIKSDELCFDIGANIGNRCEVFLAIGANVLAVEPQRNCILELKKIFESNNKFVLLEKAVGRNEGQAEMFISDTHVLSSLSSHWIESVKKSGRFSTIKWDTT